MKIKQGIKTLVVRQPIRNYLINYKIKLPELFSF